ncbi:unnamed protein product [Heligmosomoides polygyrus]|uniref:Uncharacterized protein n=1 Tax=Heligmosomoides polygyrus TaxID=6339 RepID=A0A3P8EGG1_HELPZ|nr:unnamed protein product [Heligmosomoides polygyrus]
MLQSSGTSSGNEGVGRTAILTPCISAALTIPRENEIDLQNAKDLQKETGKVTRTEKDPQLDAVEEQPLVAQKKGQNEFVSFVEPAESKQTKSIATLEKRRLADSSERITNLPSYSNNLLMIGRLSQFFFLRKRGKSRRNRATSTASDPQAKTHGPGSRDNFPFWKTRHCHLVVTTTE